MYRSECALSNFLDHFGDKWSIIIIRDMFTKKQNDEMLEEAISSKYASLFSLNSVVTLSIPVPEFL